MEKLTNVESQRMMAILVDLRDRLNHLAHVPLVPHASLLDSLRENRCLDSAELLREHWRWEQLYLQEIQTQPNEIATQVQVTARALCRALRKNLVAVELLYHHNGTPALGCSEGLQILVQTVSELTDLTHTRLEKTLQDATSQKELLVAAECRLTQADDDRVAIREQLAEMRKIKEEDVVLLDAQVQKLRTELHKINQHASHERTMLAADVQKAQAQSYNQHSNDIMGLFQQASVLEARAAARGQEHQEQEDALRRQKSKMATEVAAAVERYHSAMESMVVQSRSLELTFQNEREQCKQLNEHFLLIDEEQACIDAEENILAGIRALEREKQMIRFSAVARIQSLYRGVRCRRVYTKMVAKSKNGRKGKKKKVIY